MIKYKIFDLDGCISDDAKRRPLLPKGYSPEHNDGGQAGFTDKDFKEYHASLGQDPCINSGLVFDAIATGNRLLFVTARPEEQRNKTIDWLFKKIGKGPSAFDLLMRPLHNEESSPELKVQLLKDVGVLPEQIEAAHDDRTDVLHAYIEFGIKNCFLTDVNGCRSYPLTEGELPLVEKKGGIREKLQKLKRTASEPVKVEFREVSSQEAAELFDGKEKVEVHHLQPASRPPSAAEILRGMAATFEERNALYRDNYRMVGPIMRVLFPEGVSPEVLNSDAFHLLEAVVGKLTRFAVSDLQHLDSIHDAGVYCAILESVVAELEL